MSARGGPQRILAGLTEAQREAVCHGEGPLLVVAGAGSGKTRVITRRIAWLIEQGLSPDRIVAITFTNKAADEMRRRVESLVGEGVYVSTFHSFCARMLRREIGRIGRDPSFTIYDETDTLRLLRRLVRQMELDPATFSPREARQYIALNKQRIVGPQECEREAVGIVQKSMAALYRAYEEALAASNALDFDDLLLKALEVFSRCPEALQRYQDRYVHVLVDEYQDTNLPQHLIARALQGKHRNITAVGDPDQMIYTWRGARLENLLEFEQDFPGTRIVKLERNYRSSANILKAAGACIRHNVLRHEKELWTEKDEGEPVTVIGFGDAYEEARWVADRAAELISSGTEPRQIAVFYRTKQQSLPLEDAFARLALPHQVVDSVGFFDRREVKDICAYLRMLVNPRDEEACLRAINTPRRGIGARTVERLRSEAARRGLPLVEMIRSADELDGLSARAKAAVADFWRLYESLSSLRSDTVEALLRKLLEATDYVERQPVQEREDAREVVDMLLGYTRQHDERSPGGDLMGFLEQVALVSDVDGWNASASAVPFMTLHSAKGLEFDAVFIVGAAEELLPHRRALDDGVHGAEEAALEEERRLFYVGMTRARHRLFITWARTQLFQGRERTLQPSRFLDELPEECTVRDDAAARGSVGSAAAFRREMLDLLRSKRDRLRILTDEPLAPGARVEHPRYGLGQVVGVVQMGARQMLRIEFAEHGTMALLVRSEDVAPG